MENTLIIESLKQTIIELRDEKYQSEKNGLAKAGLDFVNMLEEQLTIPLAVNWLPFGRENADKFTELCKKKKCLCKFDDGTQIPFHHKNHPLAIMTHFAEI